MQRSMGLLQVAARILCTASEAASMPRGGVS
jgi:hypothetical protein